MELRTLRYFVAVAEAGSVTAASAQVHVAQPSLSRQLRGLERELGAELFDRVRGRLHLSGAGRELVPLARELLARADELSSVARTLASGRLTDVRFAAPSTTLSDVVAPFVATFDRDDPQPTLLVSPSGAGFSPLADGTADIVLSPRAPSDQPSTLVGRFPIFLYVPRGDPRERRRRIDISALDPSRLLLLPQSYVQREVFDAAAIRAGLALEGAREISSPEVAQALCAAGWGDAVVTADSRYGLHGLRVIADGAPLTMPIHAAWNRRHLAAQYLADLVDRLAAFTASRYGPG
jgi:DNA-binding transcriptional LysR family regulator